MISIIFPCALRAVRFAISRIGTFSASPITLCTPADCWLTYTVGAHTPTHTHAALSSRHLVARHADKVRSAGPASSMALMTAQRHDAARRVESSAQQNTTRECDARDDDICKLGMYIKHTHTHTYTSPYSLARRRAAFAPQHSRASTQTHTHTQQPHALAKCLRVSYTYTYNRTLNYRRIVRRSIGRWQGELLLMVRR